MNFNNVTFERSFGISSQLPPSTLPEVAFAGRSNVGKSSMLNALFGRKSLAKVSQKPGKTSTINFFATEGARFVDLPGYGYARVAKSEKGRWAELIEGYFNQDRNFALVVSLVDIRHEAQQLDLNMINFLMDAGLPFAVVLTKADKLSQPAEQAGVCAATPARPARGRSHAGDVQREARGIRRLAQAHHAGLRGLTRYRESASVRRSGLHAPLPMRPNTPWA